VLEFLSPATVRASTREATTATATATGHRPGWLWP